MENEDLKVEETQSKGEQDAGLQSKEKLSKKNEKKWGHDNWNFEEDRII